MRQLVIVILALFALAGCKPEEEKAFSIEDYRKMVAEVLKNLDSHTLDIDAKLSVYSEDVIHMGQGNRPITNLEDLRVMLTEERKWGHSEMTHVAHEVHSCEDHVIVR